MRSLSELAKVPARTTQIRLLEAVAKGFSAKDFSQKAWFAMSEALQIGASTLS
jgi:hypothetical protein